MSTVNEVLARKGNAVAVIPPAASALDAALWMSEKRIGSLVVTDGEAMVGIVTERDILMRIVAAKLDPATTPVSEIMTRRVAVCTPQTSVAECREMMTSRHIRRLPVIVDEMLIGIITSGDVMRQEIDDHMQTIGYLTEYMEMGAAPQGARR